jgi:endonuclease/exonuclease/phosphatase family metal-dependent hydrolase
VRKIIAERFGPDGGGKRYVIAGDFNDYTEKLTITGDRRNGYRFTPEEAEDGAVRVLTAGRFCRERGGAASGNGPLDALPHPRAAGAASLPARLPAGLAGADAFEPRPAARHHPCRPALAHAVSRGQEVDRYPRTGWDRPKASDHCPVAMTFDLV